MMNNGKRVKTWAIIGGGNGGQTFAAHLALQGQNVRLFSKSNERVKKIGKEISLHHDIEGTAVLDLVTTDITQAMDGADNIVIVLPSTWHEMTAKLVIPNLKDGQVVLILPEASCGAIAFRKYMKDMHCTADIVVGAGCTLPYATRALEPGDVYVYGMKKEVKIAALPATDNQKLYDALCVDLPHFTLCSSVLETSIDNINALMHPAPSLLTASRMEAIPKQTYEYYREGVTPSICKVIEAIDNERVAIARSLGFVQRNIRDEYINMYGGTSGASLYDILQECNAYDGLMNQPSLKTRYVLEDLPFSLVAIRALGEVSGVPTPAIDTIIALGKIMLGEELSEGRTSQNLGISEMTKEELLNYIYGKQ